MADAPSLNRPFSACATTGWKRGAGAVERLGTGADAGALLQTGRGAAAVRRGSMGELRVELLVGGTAGAETAAFEAGGAIRQTGGIAVGGPPSNRGTARPTAPMVRAIVTKPVQWRCRSRPPGPG